MQVSLIGTFTVLAVAAEEMATNAELEHGQHGVIVDTASIAAYEGQIDHDYLNGETIRTDGALRTAPR